MVIPLQSKLNVSTLFVAMEQQTDQQQLRLLQGSEHSVKRTKLAATPAEDPRAEPSDTQGTACQHACHGVA